MLWQLYQMATTYQIRPSDLVGLSNDWEAFCLDRAVFLFGTALSNDLEGQEGKNKKDVKRKREQVLERWFPEARKKKKFRSPGK